MIAIGSQGVTICPNFKESPLIRMFSRYFRLDYFGGKTWPHLLL